MKKALLLVIATFFILVALGAISTALNAQTEKFEERPTSLEYDHTNNNVTSVWSNESVSQRFFLNEFDSVNKYVTLVLPVSTQTHDLGTDFTNSYDLYVSIYFYGTGGYLDSMQLEELGATHELVNDRMIAIDLYTIIQGFTGAESAVIHINYGAYETQYPGSLDQFMNTDELEEWVDEHSFYIGIIPGLEEILYIGYTEGYDDGYEQGVLDNYESMEGETVLLLFFGAVLGAIMSFFLYIGFNISIMGASLIFIFSMSLTLTLGILIIKWIF